MRESGGDGALRALAGHAATALLTLTLVLMWFGDRGGRAPAGGAPGADRPAHYAVPKVPAPLPSAPPDADEQINIRVYEADNRGVVNITASTGGGHFFEEESGVGTGSGFVLDEAGHVLTNFHVVSGAESLEVTLFDGSTHPAEVVGVDPSNDVAVVRIAVPKSLLAPLALGDYG